MATQATVKVDFEANVAKFTVDLDKAKKGIGEIKKGVDSMSESLGVVKWGILLAGASRAISMFEHLGVQMAIPGAKALQVEASFATLAKSMGINGDKLISDISEASGVFVDKTDQMIKAQRLFIEGLKPEEIVKLTESARIAAKIMGKDVTEAFDLIGESVITLRTRGLKAAFPMDQSRVFDDYARSLGTVAKYLSEAGQRQAIVNEIFKQSEERAKQLGNSLDPTLSEKVQKVNSAYKELREQIDITFAEYIWAPSFSVMETMVSWIDKVINKLEEWYGKAAGLADKRWADRFKQEGLLSGHERPELLPGHTPSKVTPKTQVDKDKIDRKKYNEDLLSLQNEYNLKTLQLLDDSYNKRILILEAERKKAVDEARKSGMGKLMIAHYYNDAISKVYKGMTDKATEEFNKQMTISEGGQVYEIPSLEETIKGQARSLDLELSIANAIRDSKLEEAQLLYNVEKIAEAERDIFESKLKQMALTPELEKQLRKAFELSQEERARANQSFINDTKASIESMSIRYNEMVGNINDMETATSRLLDLNKARLDLDIKIPPILKEQLKNLMDIIDYEQRLNREREKAITTEGLKKELYEYLGALGLQKSVEMRLVEFEGEKLLKLGIEKDLVSKIVEKRKEEIKYGEMINILKDVGSSISSQWSTLFSELTKGTKNFQDVFVGMLQSIQNAFIDAIAKMIANYAIFGNMQGKYTSGAGLIGWIGGSLLKMQHGGSFEASKPTMFMAGEAGKERVDVTPLNQMGGGNGQPIVYNDNRSYPTTYIDAIDQKSIEDRVTGPVIRGMQSPKHRSSMKNIVRRNM